MQCIYGAMRDIVYADVVSSGRTCKMEWDLTKPNGTPRKLCDVTRLNELGWKAKVDLKEGIEISYDDFLHNNVRKQAINSNSVLLFLICLEPI